MKLLLSILTILLLTLSVHAQYKDSLKTFQKLSKQFQKHSDFVFVSSGAFGRGMPDYNFNSPGAGGSYLMSQMVQVDSFFIQKFEVSNAQYLEFVNAKLKEDSAMGKTMLPDTLVWRKVTPLGNEPYVDYYFRHPAYANYPVVGVSYTQVKAFAEWKTEQYNQQEGREFKRVQFRLPTEEEWEYAAIGAPYSYLPWNAPNTIDEKGQPRANFKMVSQLSIYRDTMHDPFYYHLETTEPKTRVYWLSNGQQYIPNRGEKRQKYSYYNDVLTPVESYEPNVHGLYQMAGNVEEMVDAYYDRDPNLYSFSHERLPPYDKPWGVTKGGSWNDPGFYLQYPIRQFYEDEHSASAEIGFRLVMVVLEY